jgi:signal transduction histidine kinase
LAAKNKLLIKQSEEMVADEKKIVELTITGQDEEKKFIANELQENFAQTLAATNLYLDFAEHSKGSNSHLIKKGKTNILKIIKDLKALSKSMLPSTFENANYLGYIEEMLDEYGRQNNLKILFRHEGRLDCYDSKIGLTLFRIIQYQLKNARNGGAKKISIKIKTGKNIRLEFVDDGKNSPTPEPEGMMLLHHIETRIGILKGKVKTSTNNYGNNLLEIDIPLEIDR